MRIVLLVTDLERGGTPLRIARLARGLVAAGVDVHVGCLAPAGPVSADLARDAIPTFACDATGARDWAAVKRLSAHMRGLRPDLIHATLMHANVAARLVGQQCHVPVLTSTATIEVERRWHAWLERASSSFDAGHIVNSPALADHVVSTFHIPRDKVHVIPPSIVAPTYIERDHAREMLNVARDDFAVLWVGRLDPVKRVDVLIDCAQALADLNARVLIAGDGPHRAEVERMIARSAAAARVHLLGWQADLGPVMSAADVFCLPSRTEGMPNALLEAMAFGLPIVASDLPTLRDVAGANERMLLVRDDSVAEFADALRRLHGDAALRDQLAHAARAWANRAYSGTDAAVRALVAVYQQVLGV